MSDTSTASAAVPTDREDTLSFLSDLAALQAEIEGVTKDATNPHFKSQYADRTSIINSLKPLLKKYNFVVTQVLVPPPASSSLPGEPVLALATTLFHVPTGKSIGDTAIVPLPKADPQGYGSAMTYTSRYALVALFVLPLLDDDDGNAASGGKTAKQASGAGAFNQTKAKTAAATTAAAKTPAATAAKTATKTEPAKPAEVAKPAVETPPDPTIDEAAVKEAETGVAPVAANATKPVTTSLWGKK